MMRCRERFWKIYSFPSQIWRCHIQNQLSLHPFQLTAIEVKYLLQLVQAHHTPQALARRARIVLTAHSHPDWSSKQLAQILDLNARLVRKWRRRWQETHSLTDLPRAGAPRRFSSEARAQVTALACSLPRSHGVPLAHWSRAELARHVITVPTLPTISARTIGRWLTAEQIRPWRFHSWQHIQEPEVFLRRARPVLQLYENAPALLKRGTWVVCTDEKTSIQAREAEQAPRPALPKHPVSQSPRYHRRGALHLMAALSVADGLVYGQCHPRKRFVDFRSFVETVIVAEAQRRRVQTVALVLDNGPTHASKQLTRWVRELSTSLEGKLTMQLYWLPTNASWLDQLEIWFSLLQRKLLQPNHFCSLDELEQAIQDFITYYNQTAKPLKWSYTVEQLEHKLATRLIRDVKSAGT
jgi:transposase